MATTSATTTQPKKLGIFLTIWLALVILINVTSLIMGVLQLSKVSGAAQMYTIFLLVLSLAGLAGAILLFMWRKIGLWIVDAAAVLGIIVNILVRQATGAGLIALVVAVVLTILAWPKLKYMK